MIKKLKDIEPSLKSRVLVNYKGKKQEWMVISQDHYGSENTVLFPVGPVDVKTFDAKESGGINKNVSDQRMRGGNNVWDDSNIRQWLNSNEKVWYEKKHIFDLPPIYEKEPGFLTGFDPEFVELLEPTTIKTMRTVTEGRGPITTKERVFFLSKKELFDRDMYQYADPETKNKYMFAEGYHIPIFERDSDRKCINPSTGEGISYWTRSNITENVYHTVTVCSSTGSRETNTASNTLGVRPAIVLNSNTRVKELSNGQHEIVYNTPPVLSIDTVKEQKYLSESDTLTVTGSVSDIDKDQISLYYSLNNKSFSHIDDVVNGKFTANIPLSKLANGENTITIEAKDHISSTFESVKVNKEENKSAPSKVGMIEYELEFPKEANKKMYLWVEKEIGNTSIKTYLKVNDLDYVELDLVDTIQVDSKLEELVYVYTYPERAKKLMLRVNLKRGNLETSKGITKIVGSFD